MKKRCFNCARDISEGEVSFLIRIELLADPTPPEIKDGDLDKDLRSEMEALVEAMKDMDPVEAEDEIFERYEYVLCKRCRERFHRRLKFPFLFMS